tara:strand:- start:745 stop:1008 length:264 start_codon:yes stop_codon:yes gene_type:complete
MFSDDEGETPGYCAAATAPAYSTAGPSVADAPGIHCSMFPNQFCFFCNYETNTDASGTEQDLYGSLADMVRHMAAMNREPSAIVSHV